MRSLVTPGTSWTTAARRPNSRFTSVDLPTFGRPTTANTGRAGAPSASLSTSLSTPMPDSSSDCVSNATSTTANSDSSCQLPSAAESTAGSLSLPSYWVIVVASLPRYHRGGGVLAGRPLYEPVRPVPVATSRFRLPAHSDRGQRVSQSVRRPPCPPGVGIVAAPHPLAACPASPTVRSPHRAPEPATQHHPRHAQRCRHHASPPGTRRRHHRNAVPHPLWSGPHGSRRHGAPQSVRVCAGPTRGDRYPALPSSGRPHVVVTNRRSVAVRPTNCDWPQPPRDPSAAHAAYR